MVKPAIEKIKSQKNAAILLIVFPLVFLISNFRETHFEDFNRNDFISSGALVILIICGLLGVKNSLRKQKQFNTF